MKKRYMAEPPSTQTVRALDAMFLRGLPCVTPGITGLDVCAVGAAEGTRVVGIRAVRASGTPVNAAEDSAPAAAASVRQAWLSWLPNLATHWSSPCNASIVA